MSGARHARAGGLRDRPPHAAGARMARAAYAGYNSNMDEMPSLLEIAVEVKSPGDRERLARALAVLTAADLSLRVATEPRSGQVTIGGTSERHLETTIDILRCAHRFEIEHGAPQVAYRETIRRASTVDYSHEKQRGGSGEFARVKIVAEPMALQAGSAFVDQSAGGTVPVALIIPGVEAGVRSVLGAGVVAGFPVIGVRATLVDGAFHATDSSVLAFEIAARAALREALQKGGPVLLEPIVKLDVVAPIDCVGSVIADLNSRRGHVIGQDVREGATIIAAQMPIAAMFGYDNTLRSMSGGQASYEMQFSHYAPVPSGDDDDDGPFRPAAAMRA
jgi:elongation factor G